MPDIDRTPDTETAALDAPDPAAAEAMIADRAIGESTKSAEPTEDDLAAFRTEYYDRHKRAIRTDRQLMFVYALLVAAFVLLAYRTETTDAKLQNGFYDACVGRNAQSASINQVRQVFIDRIAQSPGSQTPDGQVAISQLQSFLQPMEDCGPDPRQ